MWPSVLKLDISGIPEAWIGIEEAAHYYATDSVAYSYGDVCARLHGGISRLTARRSYVDVHPILAVRGPCAAGKLLSAQPRLTRFNDKLVTRDRHTCAYCGSVHPASQLEREHVLPYSRGGRDTWTNVVTSCHLSLGDALPVGGRMRRRPRPASITGVATTGKGHQFGSRVRGAAR